MQSKSKYPYVELFVEHKYPIHVLKLPVSGGQGLELSVSTASWPIRIQLAFITSFGALWIT